MLPLESENVLLCLRYGIGDVVMELPALTALRAAFPQARITALSTAPADELLDGDDRVDAVVTTARWGLRHRWDRADEATRAAIGAWVRQAGFDVVLDAGHATDAVGDAIWGEGIRSIEASTGEEQGALARGEDGVAAIRSAVRAGWGLEVPARLRPRLRPGPRHHEAAAGLLRAHGLEGARPFALSPVASSSLKRWPVERLAAVADHVFERGAGPALILEGPQNEEGAAVVAAMRHSGGAIRLGSHHLLTTAALLTRCAGLVCNDTGLMHIAGAVDAPTVAVFGPTRPAAFRPVGGRVAAAAPTDVACGYREVRSLSPPACLAEGRCLVADRGCIHAVGTDEVIARVDRLLDGWRGNVACMPTTSAEQFPTPSTVAQ